MEPFVNSFLGMEWNQYMVSKEVDLFWTQAIQGLGVFFALCAVLLMSPLWKHVLTRIALGLALVLFIPFVYLKFLGSVWHILQLFEFGLQVGVILLLVVQPKDNKVFITALKTMIAITFTAHGLYAMNVFPRPNAFIQMTSASLHISNAHAAIVLWVAGLLDIVLSLAIWTRNKAILKPVLIYTTLWGFLTAFARLWANVYGFDFWNGVWQWSFAFLVRTPHFLVPLSLCLVFWKEFKMKSPQHARTCSNKRIAQKGSNALAGTPVPI